MFEFAISNQRPRPPSRRYLLALLLSCCAHLAMMDSLIRFPWLLGRGLSDWLRQPIFFSAEQKEEPWRTVAVIGKTGAMAAPSSETLKELIYDWNKPQTMPPIRLRWGGGEEDERAAVEKPVPAVKPVMGIAEPKPQTPPPGGDAPGEASAAQPPVGVAGSGSGRPVTVYLPPPRPDAQPKEIPGKVAEPSKTAASQDARGPDGAQPVPVPKASTSPPAQKPPAQIFEDEQKAIRTDGSGLFDTKGFPLGDYASTVIERVKGNWFIPSNLRNSQGRTTVIFFIARDGRFTDARIVTSSGSSSLDLAALNAVIGSNPFPPLPNGFPADRVGAKFVFSYNERQ